MGSLLIKFNFKMKRGLLILIGLVIFSLILNFSLVKAQNEENQQTQTVESQVQIKYKPKKIEIKVPVLPKNQLGPFGNLEDFVRKNIAEHPQAEFFLLTPSNHAVQQGILEQNQDNVLTVSSKGFKMNWVVNTDTKVIFASSTNEIATGTRVKVFGIWDGNQLNAKRVVVLEKRVRARVEAQIEKRIQDTVQQLQKLLEKSGKNIDLTPLLQQLQQR